MLKRILVHLSYLRFLIDLRYNSILKAQFSNPLTIPVLIINYNQLHYLKKLVNFLEIRGFQKIIIIDNLSTYPPLIEYYEEIGKRITIERMPMNDGHMVFFENKDLLQRYGRGFYFLTDADIVPNNHLPKDFPIRMVNYLKKYFKVANKVGFALDISDIPDAYPAKEKVLNWEKKYWKKELEPNVFRANVDTTFALYKPGYPEKYNFLEFISGVRIAGDFTAKHGGWYSNPDDLSEEEIYYAKQQNLSSTWKLNEEGKHESATHLNY